MAMHLGRHMTTIHGQSKTPPVDAAKPARSARRTTNGDLADALVATIDELQAQRQELVDAIATIDAVFEKYGIQSPERRRPGRKPSSPRATATSPMPAARHGERRKRGTFEKTGTESILDFVTSKGKAGATSAEINQNWKTEGRGATADTTLSQLTKKKKLKRRKIRGAKGSRYTLA
jgi:hypothetical protein